MSSGYLHIKTPSWIMFIYVYILRDCGNLWVAQTICIAGYWMECLFVYWRGWKIIGVLEVYSKPPSWIIHLLGHFEGSWEFMGLPGYLHSKPLPSLGL